MATDTPTIVTAYKLLLENIEASTKALRAFSVMFESTPPEEGTDNEHETL